MSGFYKISNPALNANTFADRIIDGVAMTLQGTVNKTGLLLACAGATGAWTWWLARTQSEAVMLCLWGGLVGGLVFATVTIFQEGVVAAQCSHLCALRRSRARVEFR
ncbi:MAG TPA: Bax inhibitor-1/YccA family protein, partial [Candidatus Binatia bacterium]|nr:Bax inhibitor-1/YccA family protein [Candidatus Binatia bacterium]